MSGDVIRSDELRAAPTVWEPFVKMPAPWVRLKLSCTRSVENTLYHPNQPMNRPASTQLAYNRLYVLSQCVGWVGFTAIVIGLGLFYKDVSMGNVWVWIGSNCIGLLLTHLYRIWIHRFNWKQLSWQTLLPRVAVAVVLLSVLWALMDMPLYLSSAEDYLREKVTHGVVFAYSVFNGVWILLLWSLLYFGYNMANRYRRSELARVKLQAIVKEAELEALKSQINPHFIFNALNSMRALIDEDPVRARESVTQLANLLRYSLQSGQLETVPLSEELRIVNDYLALEQVRHEERLRVKLDIDPGALTLPIPPMILQTLVENAVKYGITPQADGGEIVIVARRDQEGLILQVGNPGELTDEDAIRADSVTSDSTGLGLRNAAQRLHLLFGAQASLVLKAGEPGSVIAEARIPKNLMKSTDSPSE